MRSDSSNAQAVTVSQADRKHIDVSSLDASAICIVVRADASCTEPVKICLDEQKSRAEIRVERGARATVFDTTSSKKHSIVVTLESESELHLVSLSEGSARACQSTLADGAKMFWHCFTLGIADSPHTLVSTLNGANAKSDIDWVFSVQGTERQTISVRNVFEGRSGGGEITMKGVAEGKAYAACNGMIEIAEGGGGTDTYLTQDVLMLDPTAKIDAIPGLEIRTNDVKASHSATVSRVTVEDLFYFQSRGIPPPEARSMYTAGFLGELTERIPDAAIREQVREMLLRV